MISEGKSYYSIGKVSTLCCVPIKTLRYYDKIGLLVPEYRKDESNYRYYTQDQILTLFIIRKLKLLGIPLKEIHEIISSRDSAAMGKCIQERLQGISQAIEDLNNQYSEGKMLLDRLNMGHNILETGHASWSTEEIRVEDIPVSTVLFTRRLKKNYKNTDVSVERWLELFQMVSQQKLRVVGPVILTYHNNPLEQFFKTDFGSMRPGTGRSASNLVASGPLPHYILAGMMKSFRLTLGPSSGSTSKATVWPARFLRSTSSLPWTSSTKKIILPRSLSPFNLKRERRQSLRSLLSWTNIQRSLCAVPDLNNADDSVTAGIKVCGVRVIQRRVQRDPAIAVPVVA